MNAPNSLMLTTSPSKNLASLKVSHDDLDQLRCLVHHLLIGTANGYIAVIRDVDLHAGALDDRH